mgnify:FL=1
MSALISRDPFARTEIHRETVSGHLDGCSWCGNFVSKNERTGLGKLFAYFVEHDAGRREPITGLFCSIGCMRTYQG